MKFWTVTMECAGLAEAGGVKSVAYSVSSELALAGNDVTLFIPVYACSSFDCVSDLKDGIAETEIDLCGKKEKVVFSSGRFTDTPVKIIFIRHPSFAEKRAVYVYTEEEERENPENVRGRGHRDMLFLDALLSKAVVKYAKMSSDAQKPNIIHCHDAASAILPSYIASDLPEYSSLIKCVVTIHNAGPSYHHEFKDMGEAIYYTGLPHEKLSKAMNRGRVEPFLLAGMDSSLITVSSFYAEELTNPAFSKDTDGLSALFYAQHTQITGITNGIEIRRYSPENTESSLLPYPFNPEEKQLSGKYDNRRFILDLINYGSKTEDIEFSSFLKELELYGTLEYTQQIDKNTVYFAYQGRIVQQKGLDILIPAIKQLIKTDADIRFIIVGQGVPEIEHQLVLLAQEFTGKIVYFKGYNKKTARLAVAASDFILLPSNFEPCGLEDFIAQLYGTIPIAHATGGLKKIKNGKNGFLYVPNTAEALCSTVKKSLRIKRKDEDKIREMISFGAKYVKKEYSWTSVVQEKYIHFFKKLLSSD